MSKPSTALTKQLKLLQQELFDLTANNSFVQLKLEKLWFPFDETSDEKTARKVLEISKYNKKEYALSTCLCVELYIEWQDQKTNRFFLTPLLFRPCEIIERKRIETTYSVEIWDEVYTVNPVLRKVFYDQFNFQLDEEVHDLAEFIGHLQQEFSTQNQQLVVTDKLLHTNSWQLVTKTSVGNFNYKKSLLFKDYECIIDSPNESIKSIFTESKNNGVNYNGISTFIDSLNESQQIAVRSAIANHQVIQGPPGTGKSHTVVALIETLLAENKKILFVSEKRSALDVVYNRLKKDKLENHVAYFSTDKDEKKNFYNTLKKTWLKLTENQADTNIREHIITLEKPKYPAVLLEESKINNTTIYNLEQHLLSTSGFADINNVNGLIPNYLNWQRAKSTLKKVETIVSINLFLSPLINLSKHILGESNPIQNLDKRLNQLNDNLATIEKIATRNHIALDYKTITQHAITASILGMVNKNQLNLLAPDNKQFNLFNKLTKKYELTKNKLNQIELLNKKWQKKPSISEIPILISALKQKKKSSTILSVLKRNSAKSSNYFAEFGAVFTDVEKLQMLEDIRTEWHLKGELAELKIKLKHELQITHPETEIDQIIQIRNKLTSVSQNEYIALLEAKESLRLIEELKSLHPLIQQSNNLLNYIFSLTNTSDFEKIRTNVHDTTQALPLLANYINEIKTLLELPDEVLNFVRKNNNSVEELDFLVTLQALKNETRFSTFYKNLSGNYLLENFKKNQVLSTDNAKIEINKIKNSVIKFVKEKETLLETPSSKLKKNLKEQKQIYKNEKRILLHELAKKQRHLPVKNLFDSAAEIISTLQPVWIMNTLSVAQHIPCQADIFDYVIFDESSQIPLEDAVPAIYRAKKIVVVGDEKQMPPSQFFSSNTEVQTLLDKASMVFPSQLLNWHYRSEHPALIAFSNRHFYDNELITFPATLAEYPIKLVKLNGVFENNINTLEAENIAKYYKELLRKNTTKIAIIAFSKSQQNEIENQINILKLPENSELILRNLENVQGIESDTVLISIGYAQNEKGKFLKNFGPVNQEKGANRLNVLFTRAKKQIVVFSSITSHDFTLTDNRGVHILQSFLAFVEKNNHAQVTARPNDIAQQQVASLLKNHKINFEFLATANHIATACFVQYNTKKILLVNPCLLSNETSDITALLDVITSRFKAYKIVLNVDLIQNKNQTEKEIIEFFI